MALTDSGLPKEWQAPPEQASESTKLGWLNEATEQGSSWIESQRGFRDWRVALDMISGSESTKDTQDYRSQLSGRRLKTNIRTSIAGLANLKPLWGFHAAKAFKQYAEGLNKTCWSLYLEGYWDQDIKSALAWASATCSSYVRPVYRRDVTGTGNIYLDTYGQPSVLPVQVPANGDLNRAYAVTLLDEVPIYEAHWRFRLFQDRLRPTASRYWYSKQIRTAAEQNAWKRLQSWFRRRQEDKLTDQYIGIRYTRINDLALNTTDQRVAMGQPGTSWYYEVPFLGEQLPDGRTADENDCRLYPNGRRMIAGENVVLYDGPDFNWDGELDLIQFCVDRWPWEPIGFSWVHDGWELQKAIDQIDRGAMDKLRAQQDPPLGYPIGGVTKLEADQFDPLAPRTRIGYDEQAVDQPFKMAVPPEALQIGADAPQWRQTFQEEMDYQHGTRDILELSKQRALGKDMDSIEKLLAAYGPIVQDIARGMEKSLGQVGRQVGSRIIQYLPTGRIMQYAEPETLGMDVWDYDPTSIVPSHIAGERSHDDEHNAIPSKFTKMERAKWFSKAVRFFLMPHSIHEVTQMSFRLGLMQLRQRGYQVSGATVMKSWNIPDVEMPDGNSEQERFESEKERELIFMARIQKIVEGLGLTNLMGLGSGPKKTGRPNSDKAAPHQEVKPDGRPVVSTSQ